MKTSVQKTEINMKTKAHGLVLYKGDGGDLKTNFHSEMVR